MKLRSLLFVPGDRPERFPKAAASGADALILDLEDAVAPTKKAEARAAIADWLKGDRGGVPCFVRVNPLDGDLTRADIDTVLPHRPDGIMFPKAEGPASIEALRAMMGDATTPILPIASETPAAIFQLGSYRGIANLAGLTWGAEDLPAAIGATASRNEDGSYTAPYEMVRALTLFGAHAAGVPAIETVFPALSDTAGLEAYVARARRDGFTGMMALHPAQVEAINRGFSPSDEDIARAQAIVDAFAVNPGAGALQLNGKMIDAPHLKQAMRTLALRG